MDPVSILRVLVQVDGAARAAAELEAVEAAGRKAGGSSDKMQGSLDKATGSLGSHGKAASRAANDVDGFEQSSRKAGISTVTFATSARRAAGDVDKFAAPVRKAEGALRDVDTAGQKASTRFRQIVSDAGGGTGGVDTFARAIGDLPGRLSGFTGAAIALSPVLLGIGAELVSVTAALAPLVGLLPAAAVGFTAAAQGAGVFLLATAGIKDALTEQTNVGAKAAAQALSTASQQQSSAQAIIAAQDGVRSASERVTQAEEQSQKATMDVAKAQAAAKTAQDAVTQARLDATRALQDMNAKLVDATISEARAALNLKDAQAALRTVLSGPDVEQVARAHDDVASAATSEQRAVLALTDAQSAYQALINGPDTEDVGKAQQGVAKANLDQQQSVIDLANAQDRLAAIQADTTSTDRDKAQAAIDVARAQQQVTDANYQAIDAQKTLDKLQAGPTSEDKAKALLDVADAQQGVTAAQRQSADAQAALAKAQAGPSDEDKAKAILDVRDATQQLAEATTDRVRLERDVAKANALGVNGSDQVVQALNAVKDANEGVAEAQQHARDAQRDVADAQIGVTRAAAALAAAQANQSSSAQQAALASGNLNAKFDALPPAAQAFTRELISMKPRLDALRETAASGLFPGVIDGLQSAQRNFTPLQHVVAVTADALGDLARKAGDLVGSKAFGHDLVKVGDNNARIIRVLGDAALHVADALRHVIVAAGPLALWLAQTADGWAKSADGAAKAGRESGKLASFFESTKSTFTTVAGIVEHLAVAFFNVGKAAKPTGDGILASLDSITGRFAEWSKSFEGQNSLRDFFAQADKAMRTFGEALGPTVKTLVDLAFRVLPVYAAILGALGPATGVIVTAVIAWRVAATALAGVSAVVLAATKLQTATQWLMNDALIGTRLQLIALSIQEKATAAATWLLNAAMDANPVVLITLAIAALVIGVIEAYKHIGWFRAAVDAVADALKVAAHWIIGAGVAAFDTLKIAIRAVFDWTKDHWPLLLGILAGPIGLAIALIATHFDAIKRIASDAWDAIKDGTAAVWDAIKAALGVVWEAIKTVAMFYFNYYKTLITGVWDAIQIVTGAVWDGLKKALSVVWEAIKTIAGVAWDGIKAAIVNPIHGAIDAIKDAIGHGGQDKSGLVGFLASAWDTIKTGVTGFATGIKDAIVSAFKGAAGLLFDFVKDIVGVINALPFVNIKLTKPKWLTDGNGGSGGGTGGGSMSGSGIPGQFAQGGAYARTMGKVTHPITLMGEEAPRWPEYVVPTNPAYRGRAQAIAMQAAGAVGLAQGGLYSYDHTFPQHSLADAAGHVQLSPDIVRQIAETASLPGTLFEQIAHGESNYYPGIVSSDGGYGLWQMTPRVWGGAAKEFMAKLGGLGAMLNPFANARMAKYLLDGAGGDYQKIWFGTGFVGGGGVGRAIGSAVSGIGDLIGSAIGKLPGVGSLPDWMQGLGGNILDKATSWIKDQAASVFSGDAGAAGALPKGVTGSIQDAIVYASQFGFARPSLNQLTGGQHAKDSYHYAGRAADFGAAGHTVAQMEDLFHAFQTHYGSKIRELFYTPIGYSIKNGERVAPIDAANHYDHVHLALRKGGVFGGLPFAGSFGGGGVVPGPLGAPAAAVVHGGERITAPGTTDSALVHLEQTFNGPYYADGEVDTQRLASRLVLALIQEGLA